MSHDDTAVRMQKRLPQAKVMPEITALGRRALPTSGRQAWPLPRWARMATLLADPRCPGSSRTPHVAPGRAPAFLPPRPLTEVAPALAPPPGTSAVVLWPHTRRPLSLQRPLMSTPKPLCGAPRIRPCFVLSRAESFLLVVQACAPWHRGDS